MPMQDDYKASVTTREERKVTRTYHSGLLNYRLSRSVEFLRDYKCLVVVLFTNKQLE